MNHSCAFKHKYFLEYLLNNPDIEVCNYINKDGFTLVRSFSRPIMWLLRKFRFAENRFVMRKNGISRKQIRVIKKKDIRPDDIVIGYRHMPCSLTDMADIKAFKAISMIHFHGEQSDSDLIRNAKPDVLFNECDLSLYYQQPEHHDELERIANSGYEFAQTHFRGDIVAKDLLEKLQKAQSEWKASR